MKPNEARLRQLVWWFYSDGDCVLCRVSLIGRESCTVKVLAATYEQVIRSGIGVGESNTVPCGTLRAVERS